MRTTHTSNTFQTARCRPRLALAGLAAIVAATALAGGLGLVGPTQAVHADGGVFARNGLPAPAPQVLPNANLGAGGSQILPLCPYNCGPSPSITVLDDQGLPAKRVEQAEQVTISVSGFNPGPVNISFGGQPLGTVTNGVPQSFTLPISGVPANQTEPFFAQQTGVGGILDFVWFDHNPSFS